MRREKAIWISKLAGIFSWFIFALAPLAQGQQHTETPSKEGDLVVLASGFKSGEGQLILNVFATEAGYPLDSSKALRTIKEEVSHETMEIRIGNVPFGAYAVTILHDGDGDGKMTTGFLGMPKEAIGISNNPRSYFGAPDYEDAIFEFRESGKEISIALHSH